MSNCIMGKSNSRYNPSLMRTRHWRLLLLEWVGDYLP